MQKLITQYVVDDIWKPYAAVGFYGGKAYLIKPVPEKAHVYSCILGAFYEMLITLEKYDIPDVEFVVGANDEVLSFPDQGYNASTPWPVLRYCGRPGVSHDIVVPGEFWYRRDNWTPRVVCKYNDTHNIRPWEQRKPKLGCNCGGYHRHLPWKGYNGTAGAKQGCPCKKPADANAPCAQNKDTCSGPREYFRHRVAPQHPDLMEEGNLPAALEEWSQYKYVLHLDGIGCSTRLQLYLGLGYTTFVEQSGYEQHYQGWLKEYEHYIPVWKDGPEDLAPTVTWARYNDKLGKRIGEHARAFALAHLTREARERYWVLLLNELSQRLTYQVEKPADALPLAGNLHFIAFHLDRCRGSINETLCAT
jgi:hypothetical protein